MNRRNFGTILMALTPFTLTRTAKAQEINEDRELCKLYKDALERIAMLDEADGHELSVKHAFRAVNIATKALGNKHPATIFAEREAERIRIKFAQVQDKDLPWIKCQ